MKGYRCMGGMDDFISAELNGREQMLDSLVEDAIAMLKGGKIYGHPIDVTNPRDLIAALYVAYQNKEILVRTYTSSHNVQDGE